MSWMRALGAIVLLVGAAVLVFLGIHGQALLGATGIPLLVSMAVGLGLIILVDWARRKPPLDAPPRWRLTRSGATLVFLGLLLGALVIYLRRLDITRDTVAELVSVGFLAGAVGFAELLGRYKDDPLRLLGADPTVAYVGLNVAAGIAALALVQAFGVFDKSPANRELYEVLLAGFGAIAFFRSSLFTARIGDTDVGIGPSVVLASLLDSSERMINRAQARNRADDAQLLMREVSFPKAYVALPLMCFTIYEKLSEDEQRQAKKQIADLKDASDLSDAQRCLILGVYLIRIVGHDVLARAVAALQPSIKPDPPSTNRAGQTPAGAP